MHLFPDTLPALLKALEYSAKVFEIIIIDDCSTDGSIEFLEINFPQIIVLQNKQNSGFSVTINKGIFAAKNDLVLLLNSDVKLMENYFKHQLKYFQMPDTFGVMGEIIGWEDEQIQDGAKYPKFEGFKLKTSSNYLLIDNEDNLMYSMYLSGANALIKRDKLVELKGFNELYSPFYMEDVDLSVRAWRSGLKCYFEPLSICRHKSSESISSKENKEHIRTIYNRNKLYFHALHLDGIWFAGWCIQSFFELIIRIFTFRFDYLRSCIAFIQNRDALRKSNVEFKNLCNQTGINLSLPSIVRLIHHRLKNSEKTVFRS